MHAKFEATMEEPNFETGASCALQRDCVCVRICPLPSRSNKTCSSASVPKANASSPRWLHARSERNALWLPRRTLTAMPRATSASSAPFFTTRRAKTPKPWEGSASRSGRDSNMLLRRAGRGGPIETVADTRAGAQHVVSRVGGRCLPLPEAPKIPDFPEARGRRI